ncbi:MAG: hypothetical protein KJ947_08825 [Alphaproteobacteria bacterium]|nr:hypothetical protein [Alphaproteobacteria bacterium]MBU1549658.1 hypothetical protein [Alphaproteobacteria bacterium]MBU2387606.1 hypothetical protein [Alphaproteobacteria bacterium]
MKRYILVLIGLAVLCLTSCKSEEEKKAASAAIRDAVTAISQTAAAPLSLDSEIRKDAIAVTLACSRASYFSSHPAANICDKVATIPKTILGTFAVDPKEQALWNRYIDTKLEGTLGPSLAVEIEAIRASLLAKVVTSYQAWEHAFSGSLTGFQDVATAASRADPKRPMPDFFALSLLASDRQTALSQRLKDDEALIASLIVGGDQEALDAQNSASKWRGIVDAAATDERRQSALEDLIDNADNSKLVFAVTAPPPQQNDLGTDTRQSSVGTFLKQAESYESLVGANGKTRTTTTPLTQEAARHLVEDCVALLALDEQRFDEVCTGPVLVVLNASIDQLGGLTDNPSSSAPKHDPDPTGRPSPPELGSAIAVKAVLLTQATVVPANVDWMATEVRQRQVDSLVASIRETSRSYAEAAYSGSIAEMAEADAKIELIHEKLKLASARELPSAFSEPVSLLEPKALQQLTADNERLIRIVASGLAFDPTSPGLLIAEASLNDRAKDLDKASLQVPARETLTSLIRQIDPQKLSLLIPSIQDELPSHIQRHTDLWRQKFAALPGTLVHWQGPRGPPEDPLFPRSGRVLSALRALSENSGSAVNAFAALRAEHMDFTDSVRAEGGEVFEAWKFSLESPRSWMTRMLSPRDLAVAVQMLDAYASDERVKSYGDTSVNLEHAVREMRDALIAEEARRAILVGPPQGYPPGRPPSVLRAAELYAAEWSKREPTPTERHFRFQLAESMFYDLTMAPANVREGLSQTVTAVLNSDEDRLRTIVEKLYGIGGTDTGLLDKAARSLDIVPSEELASIETLKEKVSTIASLLAERRARAEKKDLISVDPKKWNQIKLWAWWGGSDPAAPLVPPGPPPSPLSPAPSGVAFLLGDAKLERSFIELETSISTAEALLASTRPFASRAIEPPLVGKQTGQRRAKSGLWSKDGYSFTAMELAEEKTRYADELSDWRGFFDNEKRPYNFDRYVKNFKTLRGVGGGIHMGVLPEVSKSDLMTLDDGGRVEYDVGSKYITLTVKTGKRYHYGPVEPVVLKALYAYVSSQPGVNLAVTIGALGERQIAGSSGGSPVLLDPHFVDNVVGQNLFLADTIPWSLDKAQLPDGTANPAQDEFSPAKEDFEKDLSKRTADLMPHLQALQPFSLMSATEWSGLTANKSPYVAALGAVATATDKDGLKERVSKAVNDSLFSGLVEQAKAAVGTENQLSWRLKLRLAYARELDASTREIVQSLGNLDGSKREQIILSIASIIPYTEYGNPIPRKLTRLVASVVMQMLLDQNKTAPGIEEVAEILPNLFTPSAALAVLFDNSARLSLADDKILVAAELRYSYASATATVKDGEISFQFEYEGSRIRMLRAQHASALEAAANKFLPALATDFAPLRSVKEYAALTAFLRWVACPDETMKKCQVRKNYVVDFSSLGQYPLSDRMKTPTPDLDLR